jgi:hypothetical protein
VAETNGGGCCDECAAEGRSACICPHMFDCDCEKCAPPFEPEVGAIPPIWREMDLKEQLAAARAELERLRGEGVFLREQWDGCNAELQEARAELELAKGDRDEARAELAAERARREASDAEAARLLRACHYNQAWAGHMADRAEARRWKRAAWAMRVEAEVYRRWWLESESVDRFADEAIARADAAEARARGLVDLVRELLPFARGYAAENPKWTPAWGVGAGVEQDPGGVHAAIEKAQAALAAAEGGE